jgi:hypothetical protein
MILAPLSTKLGARIGVKSRVDVEIVGVAERNNRAAPITSSPRSAADATHRNDSNQHEASNANRNGENAR